jgi:alkylation response protein AidB-like acyl-CoA dehydrogenase
LNGVKSFVPCAASADYILAPALSGTGAGEDALTLCIVDMKKPGVEAEPITTLTGEKLCTVRFNKVRLSKGDFLGQPGCAVEMLEAILEKAALLKCAEVSGACQAVMEMSGAYAGERRQFGRPIGAFQSVQHRLVDMLIEVEGLKFLVYQAAWLMEAGLPWSEQAAMAKVKANNVYQRVALDGIKVHGAIGFTREHDAGMFYRRVPASRFFPRRPQHYLEKVAQGIGL